MFPVAVLIKVAYWDSEISNFYIFFKRLKVNIVANGKMLKLSSSQVIILFHPNLLWMFPVTVVTKSYLLRFWNFKLNFFFKKIEILLTLDLIGLWRDIQNANPPTVRILFQPKVFWCSLWQSSQELPIEILKCQSYFVLTKDWNWLWGQLQHVYGVHLTL